MNIKLFIITAIAIALNACKAKETPSQAIDKITDLEKIAIESETLNTLELLGEWHFHNYGRYHYRNYHTEEQQIDFVNSHKFPKETENYIYTSSTSEDWKSWNAAIFFHAIPKRERLDPWVAIVFRAGKLITLMICKSPQPIPDIIPIPDGADREDEIRCPSPLRRKPIQVKIQMWI